MTDFISTGKQQQGGQGDMNLTNDRHTPALLALLTQAGIDSDCPDIRTDCPTDDVLSAYIDGSADTEARQYMARHLNHCCDCRERWIEVSQVLQSLEQSPEPATASSGQRLWQRLRDWLQPFALPGAAVACSLAIVMLVLQPAINTDPLDQWYSQLPAPAHTAATSAPPLPWESNTFGFSHQSPDNAQTALGAGLWQGLHELGLAAGSDGDNPFAAERIIGSCCWQQSDWVDYYRLGRWLSLVWTQTQRGTLDGDNTGLPHRADHQQFIASLQDRLASQSGPQALAARTELTQLSQALATGTDGDALARLLVNSIQRLGPTDYD